MAKVTIYDVAQRAGVSTATVSKVLNGTGKISKMTCARVTQAIEELHYRPSIIASALKKHRTYSIGLLVPDITNPFYAELTRAVEDAALSQGYAVLICSTDNMPEREAKQIDLLMRKQLDGVIIATSEGMSSELLHRLGTEMPHIVFVDRVIPNSPHPIVATDHYLGSYQAAEHLLQLGHRKLAIFLEPLYLRASLERLRGFATAVKKYGSSLENALIFSDGFGAEAGYRLAQQLLQRKQRPTAVFATNDLIALGALQKLHEEHIMVPEQLSIVGYDDIQIARMVSPALTTIAQPVSELSKLAVEYLLGDEEVATTRTLLAPKLVIRHSTAALK